LRATNAVFRRGMTCEGFRHETLFLFGLQLLQKLNESLGIVTGGVFVFQPKQVGFPLGIAAKLREQHRRDDSSETAKHQGDGGILPDFPASSCAGRMTRRHVPNFVSHYAR